MFFSCQNVNRSKTDSILSGDTLLSEHSKVENDVVINDNSISNLTYIKEDLIEEFDSINKDFRIKYTIHKTSSTVHRRNNKAEGIQNYDQVVTLTVIKGEKFVLKERVFRKEDFKAIVPKSEMKYYQLSVFLFDFSTDNSFVFFVNICHPDTDICYTINMSISENGKIVLTEYDQDFDD